MPQTPLGSPKVKKKTEEEKSLESSQENMVERLEDDSQYSEEESSQCSEEENFEQPAPASEETPQNPQPRTSPTLFGFAPSVNHVVVIMCPHGHLHVLSNTPPSLLTLLSIVSMMNALGLVEENDLEENLSHEEQAQEEVKSTEQQEEVSDAKNQKEEEPDEEHDRGYSYFM